MADIDCVPAPAMTPSLAGGYNGADGAPMDPAGAGTAAVKMTFTDVLRALNPLQHLPVIGTIYRAVTGDTIQPGMRIAGSALGGLLTGGPLGVLGTVAGCFLEEFWRMGFNLPDPQAPPSGVAFAKAGVAPLAGVNAVGGMPESAAATAIAAAAAPVTPSTPALASSDSGSSANAARRLAGMAAYSWVAAGGTG